MLVDRHNFKKFIDHLKSKKIWALDTETSGLMPYHGDVLFSIIFTEVVSGTTYYLNYNTYPGIEPLPEETFLELQKVFDEEDRTWVLHNAKFDMAILANDKMELKGDVVCIWSLGRIEYNDHFIYRLDAQAQRIGEKKDDAVKIYIAKNKLQTKKEYRELNKTITLLHYNKVPFEIIKPYGERDGLITAKVFNELTQSILMQDKSSPENRPKLHAVVKNETRLTKTVYRMEKVGIRIDGDYCKDAMSFYKDKIQGIVGEFKSLTGHEFAKSTKLFQELFKDEKEKWAYTEKRNPIFDKEQMEKFDHPAAKLVVGYSKAKKQVEYFQNFLYFADKNGVIHTEFRQAGTASGRFSSADPNLQNLTKPDKYEEVQGEEEFPVRRAFVPREGRFLAMLDYDQMEYRMMLDKANATSLINKVLGGLDVHQATADLAGISRKDAKTTNFAVLYGSGLDTLAEGLKVSRAEAKRIRDAIFEASPEIYDFIRGVTRTAKTRGYIFNWLGRRSHFPDPNFAYKAPNYYIQGGCADVVKLAMNQIDDYLQTVNGINMLLTIHDELIFEVHPARAKHLAHIKNIMEGVYPHKKLPLTCGIEHSFKSLADKVEGIPL